MRRHCGRLCARLLPQRLASYLAETGAPKGWSNAALQACEQQLHRWALHPTGTEGFEKAEVTAGGVDTRDLASAYDGGAGRAGLVLHRRSGRRDRATGRIQLPVGMGFRSGGGESGVRKTGNREQGIGRRFALTLRFVLLAALMLAWPLTIPVANHRRRRRKERRPGARGSGRHGAGSGRPGLADHEESDAARKGGRFFSRPALRRRHRILGDPRLAGPGPHRVQQASRRGAVLSRRAPARKSPTKARLRCRRSRWTTGSAAATTPSRPSSRPGSTIRRPS